MSNEKPPQTTKSVEDRGIIAKWVIGLSAAGLVILSVTIMLVTAIHSPADLANTTQMVYTSLLPLLGTWVGTVLAYYFSKENFETAARTTREHLETALQQKLQSMRAEEHMMARATITKVTIPTGKSEKDVMITQIHDLLGGKITRVPVFYENYQVVCVVHSSLLYQFIAEENTSAAKTGNTFNLAKATLEDLLKHGEMRRMAKDTLAFVASGATLADAKAQMEARVDSQDVFITTTGNKDDPVLGWLTNTRISRLAKS